MSTQRAPAPDRETNPPVAAAAGKIVRGFEALSIRGAPTLLGLLSNIAPLGAATARVRVGDHWFFFPAYDEYWARYLWAAVPYEPDVEQVFRKIGSGRVLIDCGANIGYWSVRAADFGFTRTIAIEANPELMPYLEENMRINGTRGVALHRAIYSSSGEKLFLQRTKAHAQAGLGATGLPVTSIAIADLARDLPAGQEIVAKLDVEGAELPALQGARGVESIIFLYEDFPKHGMRVTQDLLTRGMAIFGVTSAGESRPIRSVEEALAFNAQEARPRTPSNLVACNAGRAQSLERELAAG